MTATNRKSQPAHPISKFKRLFSFIASCVMMEINEIHTNYHCCAASFLSTQFAEVIPYILIVVPLLIKADNDRSTIYNRIRNHSTKTNTLIIAK